ncbi:seven-hairpin glycosidase [Mytilinidion resinicola]|uniref:alpha-1,2-Mannosidase n=1 Tax=Mytilinidion resinicola TaxID=574789 RepID=A0A6A6YYS8_9PEZI|nr:seven-hairpin glycosidase [Mytilinidion resinicola]KAF2813981.1 seven-hairpin glycosidase [Mytilinidion resinicola]
MFRYRRYRVFVALAVVTIFALYKFGSTGSWRQPTLLPTGEKSAPLEEDSEGTVPPISWMPRPHEVVKETKKLQVEVSGIETSVTLPLETPPPIASVSHPVQKAPPGAPKSAKEQAVSPEAAPSTSISPVGMGHLEDDKKQFKPGNSEVLHEHGEGRHEVPPVPSDAPAIYWEPLPEHFPVPSGSTIQLPSGSPKPIPKIQFDFKEETEEAKTDRLSKLKTIKGAFLHSWAGYKDNAWMKDELSPVSGGFRNPFGGWGATLVDTLDTLWMMGLKPEFEEAVEAVKTIDFTTSPRGDIPMFETTIRYLGGLLAAYDISDQKYPVLLEKAAQLGEVLMGAFDTPNRMPITYYYWRPTFATQPHRASSRVILAEIGSLSVEFTRLAQLTGEPRYYDAIARITNALEVYQKETRLPGMWPKYIDASGCKRPTNANSVEPEEKEVSDATPSLEDDFDENELVPLELPKPVEFIPVGNKKTEKKLPEKEKRQLEAPDATFVDGIVPRTAVEAAQKVQPTIPAVPECEEQGMVTTDEFGTESYTLGGMSDSTYEYLPKEWLLLGGRVDSYRTMYEKSVDVVKEHLLFRPMLPNGADVLFSGSLNVPMLSSYTKSGGIGDLEYENAHLTCFAGGMFALGAKIFNRDEDLEIAKKLTEGCVWSYNATTTGIMPESFYVVGCESQKSCEWNETKWWEQIDPYADNRIKSYKDQMGRYTKQLAEASASYEAAMAAATGAPEAQATGVVKKEVESEVAEVGAEATESPKGAGLEKRQLDPTDEKPSKTEKKSEEEPLLKNPSAKANDNEEMSPSNSSDKATPTLPAFPILYSPRPPQSHEEFVKNRIQEERLPEGITNIQSKKYILRPEAIESVFYLYRITGDAHWREVGWNMYQAIAEHTTTEYGNSAIDDVTKTAPQLTDEMESFWLAETLKYFYLLFAEESAVSLDDWVLNTEAHPFKRGA